MTLYRAGMSDNPTVSPKADLRRHYRRVRAAVPDHAARSRAICERVVALPAYQQAGAIHCYLPIKHEVDTRPIVAHALAHGKRVAVPIVEPGSPNLVHSWLTSTAADTLQAGTFGTLQPGTVEPATPGDWHLMLVPLLAFDRTGTRLGYGGGYYDRLLEAYPQCRPLAVGVAFAAQEAPALPREPFDVPLPIIVTEDETIVLG